MYQQTEVMFCIVIMSFKSPTWW